MFFFETPDASRRLAAVLNYAVSEGSITIEQHLEVVKASRIATSWGDLPEWFLGIVDVWERHEDGSLGDSKADEPVPDDGVEVKDQVDEGGTGKKGEPDYRRPDLIRRGREYGLTPEQSEVLSLYL